MTTAQDYQAEIRSILGADAPRVLARYPLDDFASPSVALATVWTDAAWACPALVTASRVTAGAGAAQADCALGRPGGTLTVQFGVTTYAVRASRQT